MNWIVLKEEKGKVLLVSKNDVSGMIPKGSFLTIEGEETKFIIRVEDSLQLDPYSPTPLVIDMDLTPLGQDRKSKNIIVSYRVCDFSTRKDGLIDYIKPQSIARRSSQEEIDVALGSNKVGPKVFVGTVQYNQNQLIYDEKGDLITAVLPIDMFYHQMLICGKTGSGKTVAAKYISQYFVEEFQGAVLAINVKDVDLLKMNKPSETKSISVKEEWKRMNQVAHGIENYTIYYPANTEISASKAVTLDICQKITLDVKTIDPESLTGLLNRITDIAAMNLPNIFRWWQEREKEKLKQNKKGEDSFRFINFVEYFQNGTEDGYVFKTLNARGEASSITLHRGTFDNIQRNLDVAVEFFDNIGSKTIDETDILVNGKMSVIDVAGKNGIQFGSILLRHLLHKIVSAKSEKRSNVPILIIIDEVHMFYNEDSSYEALGDLDTICRTGRSQEIGVIFSSQSPGDIPKGLSSVINTKIFFKSDVSQAKIHGVTLSTEEMESLKKGYAIASIHEMSQLKVLKFPLSYAGVFEKEESNG